MKFLNKEFGFSDTFQSLTNSSRDLVHEDEALLKSARNISGLRMLPTNVLNTLDVVKHRKIIMTLDAVRIAENLWGQQGGRDSSEHPTNNNNGTNS